MQDFEKMGLFYLGKQVEVPSGKLTEELLLYPSKDLTTHAVILGMTGSGKTGLGIDILEEAAIDKIPAIIVDPKGDLGNLLLTFPRLSAEDFLPWIDEGEAERKGEPLAQYAEQVAASWKKGLAEWGEGPDRLSRLRDSAEITLYTPASRAGIPLSILSSFAAPSKEITLDPGAMRDRVLSLTSSLLGLIGVQADPIKSREHILIATIIDQAWSEGKSLDIAGLIQQVQKPPFQKVGVLDLETFFPSKERVALSVSLNNLLASPGFQAWMEGETLDINTLLHTPEGKPRLAILSIAHLSDTERMFFVTLLLNELIAWMRRQAGTSSLRAILYMDEIFGFFPPSAMPPSKTPMLTLLKQARAYGLGIVLATQNPVDLDYKGLSNCGTWFIGKLQTERDKMRVLEGLKSASNGELDSTGLDRLIALTGNRAFIMRTIYQKEPLLFQTRWTLSYLRGPLTLTQISKLTRREETIPPPAAQAAATGPATASKPTVPLGITEYFLQNSSLATRYQPCVVGLGKLHFIDAKNQIDVWEEVCLLAPFSAEEQTVQWEEGQKIVKSQVLSESPLSGVSFEELPSGLMQPKNYPGFEKAFAAVLYQNQTFPLFKAPLLKLVSQAGESEGDFKARLDLALREKRDEAARKLKEKYDSKISTLTEKVRRIQEKLSQKQQKAATQKTETWISFGATLLGALFGRGVTKGTITQAGTSLKRAGKISQGSQGVEETEAELKVAQQQLEDLQDEMKSEIASLEVEKESSLEKILIRPRKSDIHVEKVAIAWRPIP